MSFDIYLANVGAFHQQFINISDLHSLIELGKDDSKDSDYNSYISTPTNELENI